MEQIERDTHSPRLFSEAMDELLELCETHKAPAIVTSGIASLIAQNERKLFCWMGDPLPASGTEADALPAGLYASDFLEKLVLAVRALDWEVATVLIHSLSPPEEIEVTLLMIEAASEVLEVHYLGDGAYDIPRAIPAIFRAMLRARSLPCPPTDRDVGNAPLSPVRPAEVRPWSLAQAQALVSSLQTLPVIDRAEQVERVARAICAADNVDPDMEVCGMGVQLPVGILAPAWHARRWQAMAAIEAYDPPQVAKALRGELGRQ